MMQQSQTKDPCGTVLCVLSSEQQEAYGSELATLQRSGLRFAFQESPEQALDGLGELSPVLVLVGMDVGTMEGLEFVALLFKRYPKFAQRVIVVPDKGDPFPPMMQFRDPKTGRSSTETVDFRAIQALVESLSRQHASAAKTPVVSGPEPVARTPGEPQSVTVQPIRAVSKPQAKPVEPQAEVERKPAAPAARRAQAGPDTSEPRREPSAHPPAVEGRAQVEASLPQREPKARPAAAERPARERRDEPKAQPTGAEAQAQVEPTRAETRLAAAVQVDPSALQPQPPLGAVPKPRKPPGFERQAKLPAPEAEVPAEPKPKPEPERPLPIAAREPAPSAEPAKDIVVPAADRVSSARGAPTAADDAAAVMTAPAGGSAVLSAIEQALTGGQQPEAAAAPHPSQPLDSHAEGVPSVASPSAPPPWVPSVSPVPARGPTHPLRWWVPAVIAAAAIVTIVVLSTRGSEPAPTPPVRPAPAGRHASRPPSPSRSQPTAAFAAPSATERSVARSSGTPEQSSMTPAVDLSRRVTLPIRFPKGSAEYTIADADELRGIIAAATRALSEKPSRRLEVGGHASQEGSDEFNVSVGSVRANNVARYLTGQGIPAGRVVLRSYGSSMPLKSAAPEANRRATVRILE
jgi:outer membrane protein OmpA-like peptidoglycan-associated protein